jgi:hypothetical protein
LWLGGTNISAMGVERLRESMPNLQITGVR